MGTNTNDEKTYKLLNPQKVRKVRIRSSDYLGYELV